MARRRGNKEGSIFQDKDGVWWAQLSQGSDGKRPKRRAETRSEAQSLLKQMEKEREQGVKLGMRQPKLSAFLQIWLDEVVRPSSAPKTHQSYKEMIDYYIVPKLGHHRLDRLEPYHVQQWINELANNKSISTARNACGRLKTALNIALQWGYVARNVASLIELPAAQRRPVRPWTPEQARVFLDAVSTSRESVLYLLVLSFGLRRGEALGLRWTDLDWDQQRLLVGGQVQRIGKANVLRAATKTKSGTRTLHLPNEFIPILREHWRNQQEERDLLGADWKEHGLMFPAWNGEPLSPEALVGRFKRALNAAKLPPIRFHDLRHSAASIMLAQGIPLTTVSKILGHSSVSITGDIYGHAFDEDKKQAAEEMAHLLRKKKA